MCTLRPRQPSPELCPPSALFLSLRLFVKRGLDIGPLEQCFSNHKCTRITWGVKMQILIPRVWGGAWDSAFPTCSQVMQRLLVWGPSSVPLWAFSALAHTHRGMNEYSQRDWPTQSLFPPFLYHSLGLKTPALPTQTDPSWLLGFAKACSRS